MRNNIEGAAKLPRPDSLFYTADFTLRRVRMFPRICFGHYPPGSCVAVDYDRSHLDHLLSIILCHTSYNSLRLFAPRKIIAYERLKATISNHCEVFRAVANVRN